MTKKQIIERLKAAGVTGWDKKNLAELEALAAKHGVSLGEPDGEGAGTTTEVVGGGGPGTGGMNSALPVEERAVTSAPTDEVGGPGRLALAEYDPTRLITPQMACSVFPGAGVASEA